MTFRWMACVLIVGLVLGCLVTGDDGTVSASPLVLGPEGFILPAFGEGEDLAARLLSGGLDEPSLGEAAFESLASDLEEVWVTDGPLQVELSDGRTISVWS